MNVLKSLVDWEKLCREAKQNKEISIHEDASAGDSEAKNSNDSANNFEKVKTQKSTMEAAISEVFNVPLMPRKRKRFDRKSKTFFGQKCS